MKNIKSLLAILSLVFVFSLQRFGAEHQLLVDLTARKSISKRKKAKSSCWQSARVAAAFENQASTINKLAKKYAGRDVVFYFISTDSTSAKSKNYASDDDIRKFAESNKLTIAILRDSEGATTLEKIQN